MQNLEKRTLKNTPTGTSRAGGNCGVPLNEGGRADCVAGLKTFSKNPEETLTGGRPEPGLRVPVVFVRNMRGKAIQPCSPRTARLLLNSGEAKVVIRTPFAIQLTKPTGETVQKGKFGGDIGYLHIGLSALNNIKEFLCIWLLLRDDLSGLLTDRAMFRRNRRGRKTPYRKAKFMNRAKPKGWLPPSLENKIAAFIKLLQLVESLVPMEKKITLEIAPFDIQKIKNPNISGVEYQRGERYQFESENVRKYVLWRDKYTCQCCKGKSGDKKLHVHHVIFQSQQGSNAPANQITLCRICHEKYHKGEVELKMPKPREYKAETFMSIMSAILPERLRALGYEVEITFGYITAAKRKEFGIKKSHVNDAFISGGGTVQQRGGEYFIKQVRRNNRKLFKGAHSGVKNTAPRFMHGLQRYDKVEYKGKECFIFGRRATGYFDLRTLDGTKIHASAKVKDLKLLESAKTFLIEKRF